MKRLLVLLTLALAVAAPASASSIMPSFDGAPAGWITDRYQPNVFADIGLFQGRDNVLEIGISSLQGSANRGAQSGTFYNTQGMQYAMSGAVGDVLSADLYVDASWVNPLAGHRRTDMWNAMTDGTNVTAYAIAGFTNYGGAGRFRVWDEDTVNGWVDVAPPVNYGAWNSFSIALNALSIDYYVNGFLAYSDLTLNGTTNFGATIMQAYNFFDPAILDAIANNYEVHWSNVPEPASMILLGTGIAGLVARRRLRRRA